MDEEIGKLIEPARLHMNYNEPGWWVLGVFGILFIIFFVWISIKNRRKNAYRRTAIKYLNSELSNVGRLNSTHIVYNANNLMKRIAMAKYGRKKVAAKVGQEWIDILNNSSRINLFGQSDKDLLDKKLYIDTESVSNEQAEEFITKTTRWIKKHRNAF